MKDKKKMAEFYKHRGEHCGNCDGYTFYSVINYDKCWLYCTECGFILRGLDKGE